MSRVSSPERDKALTDLPKIAPPNRVITPLEIEAEFDQAPFTVQSGEGNGWEFSVRLGKMLGRLAGTKMEPEAVARYLLGRNEGTSATSVDEVVSALVSDGRSSNGLPLVSFDSGYCRIQGFAGRDNGSPRIISAIGSAGAFPAEARLAYQQEIAQVTRPVFAHRHQETLGILGIDGRGLVLSIDDDCAASVATIGGIQVYLAQRGLLSVFKAQEINVGVLTSQSLVMMALLAERFKLPTLIRFGWMEYGLTWGKAANYIANTGGAKTGLLSVGDMGDAARRVRGSDALLELVREDDYYDRATAQRVTWARLQPNSPYLRFIFAMGGMLTEGVRKIAGGYDADGSLIAGRASREHQDQDFYVVMSQIETPLAQWAATNRISLAA